AESQCLKRHSIGAFSRTAREARGRIGPAVRVNGQRKGVGVSDKERGSRWRPPSLRGCPAKVGARARSTQYSFFRNDARVGNLSRTIQKSLAARSCAFSINVQNAA